MSDRLGGERDPDLADVLSRWDALVVHWDLSEEERTSLLGGFDGGEIDDVATYDAGRGEIRMRLLVEFAPVLDAVHRHRRRTRFWLRAPNRHLGEKAPIDVMTHSTAWVRWLIDHVGLTS